MLRKLMLLALALVSLTGLAFGQTSKSDTSKKVQSQGGVSTLYTKGTYTFVGGPYAGQTVEIDIPLVMLSTSSSSSTFGAVKITTGGTAVFGGITTPLEIDNRTTIDPVNDAIRIVGTQTAPGDTNVNVTPKATQGANGVAVQELKDAGRQYWSLEATDQAGTANTSTQILVTSTSNVAGTVTVGVTSYVPSVGKTLRVQTIVACTRSGGAASAWTLFTFRHNTAGACTTASKPVITLEVEDQAAASAEGSCVTVAIPDGLEIFGDGTQAVCLSHLSSASTNLETTTVLGYQY